MFNFAFTDPWELKRSDPEPPFLENELAVVPMTVWCVHSFPYDPFPVTNRLHLYSFCSSSRPGKSQLASVFVSLKQKLRLRHVRHRKKSSFDRDVPQKISRTLLYLLGVRYDNYVGAFGTVVVAFQVVPVASRRRHCLSSM